MSHENEIGLGTVRRILVLRLDEIGDLVLTTPFLRELRQSASQAWITLVVKPETRNLVEFCPYVDQVLAFDCPVDGRLSKLQRRARALMFAARHLWLRFDLAVVPRWGVDYYHSATLAYLSRAPRRVAYSEHSSELRSRLNEGNDRALTQTFESKGLKHEVEWNLNFLRLLGGKTDDSRLELWLTEDDRAFAEQVLSSHGVRDGDFLVAFAPGAGASKRRWPLNRFIELGRYILREFAARLVVVGGPDDEQLGARLEAELGRAVINVAGHASLRQTAAVLERCRLIVANDSGPMHLAAAAGNAVVEISCHPQTGSPEHGNSPARFGPWGVPCAVLQPAKAVQPCADGCSAETAHCILGVTVEQVYEAAYALASQYFITPARNAGLSYGS